MAIAALLLATSTRAQLQQPFVYTTGSLTATSASPLQILGFPVVIAAFSILFLVLYRDTAGWPFPRGSKLHHRKTVYAMSIVLIFIPMFAVNGCGGEASSTPAPQGRTLVTPSGTYTLVLTRSAMNASGKSLQLTPIQLTLVVN